MRTRIVATLCAVSALGCIQEAGKGPPDVAQARTALGRTEPNTPNDEPSPHAIIVHWDDDAAERKDVGTMNVVVENTTEETIRVELDIVALDVDNPTAQPTRGLGRRVVSTRSSTRVRIPISMAPMQVVGGDVPLMVRASYAIEGRHPFTGEDHVFSHTATSELRHVEFSADYRTASLRNERGRLANNDALVQDARGVKAQRVFDRDTQQMRNVPDARFTRWVHTIQADDPYLPVRLRRQGGGQ